MVVKQYAETIFLVETVTWTLSSVILLESDLMVLSSTRRHFWRI